MTPDEMAAGTAYDPRATQLLCFAEARTSFLDGGDHPRAYLERCLETIEALEPQILAFVTLNIDGARAAADASRARYAEGRPLTLVDGMPLAIKDLFETEDMPTEMGSEFHKGNRTGRDAAHVYALRHGGALILGKTVTTEFGVARPGPTRNPFDTARTPGGSSSGTAAAVGAAMVPAGTGSHARGSIIRPAGYCANWAIKPTFGALNRGGTGSTAKSMGHLGVLAGSLEDMWILAQFIASQAGGDPGYPGLYGDPEPAPARRPARLGLLRAPGWEMTDGDTQTAFEALAGRLSAGGVVVLDGAYHPVIADYEKALGEVRDVWLAISAFESVWPMQTYRDKDASLLGKPILGALERGEKMSLDDYRSALRRRDEIRSQHAAMARHVDAFLTLSSPGPAPEGMPVGDCIYNEASSILGAPALSLPLLAVRGLPQGVQLLGFNHEDYRLTGYARWMAETELG